jgi:imidazolonepropionase-like amidohydrolase
MVANGPDEMRVAARKAFRRGATQIKVMVSGGVISFTDELDHTQLTVEELRAVVVEAEARNTYVTAHSHNSRGIRNGLEAGVQCFEHGSWLDEETAALMAEADAALVPTLTIAHVMGTDFERFGLPPAIVQRIEQVSGHMEQAIGYAREAGVLTGAGTDLLGPQQDRRAMEIALRAEVVGAMDAIVAQTSTNAKILRADDRIGSVEPGKLADVIAVRGDPLEEPQLFSDPERVVLVVKGGEVVKSPATA